MADDLEERLRKLEAQVEQLTQREPASAPAASPTEVESKGAKPQLRALPTRELEDGTKAYRAEVFNYGKGTARNVRWWLIDRKSREALTTVGGGKEVTLGPRERIELEVTVLPGIVDNKWQVVLPRLAWTDAKGEHEVGPHSMWR